MQRFLFVLSSLLHLLFFFFFFFNDTATTEIYTLSLHDALPICVGDGAERRAEHTAGGTAAGGRMSLTVCLAPANTVAYPNGGGHLWVYIHWALALKALGCRVIWLEGTAFDDSDTSPPGPPRRRGGRAWLYTPPPISLPEWPALPPSGPGRYTTLAHWWGGTFEYNGTTFCNEKRVSFLEYLDLPTRTSVPLELAVCLAEHYDEYRRLMEPKGWTLREAWDVSATPEAYRTYVQRSRGEFSCAKPAYVALQTASLDDRTLCYLASGKPAVVQHTGPSRWLPSGEGVFRFRNMDEATRALAAAEADYDRHCRAARALVEEYCDGRRVVEHVLERALHPGAGVARTSPVVDLPGGLRNALEQNGEAGAAELIEVLRDLLDGASHGRCRVSLTQLKARVYRLAMSDGPLRSVVLKRLDPIVAQRTRLVAERWLPALGLGDRCARLLGTAADRRGDSVWHVYEDLGEDTLATNPSPECVEATVDLMAQLHTRAPRHPVH